TLAPQQRPLGPGIGQLLVLLQNRELVCSTELPTRRLRRRVLITHHAILGAPEHGCVRHGHFLRGPVSPWWDGGLQQVSHVSLTDRAGPPPSTTTRPRRPGNPPRRAGLSGLAARLVEPGRLGTKWESPALARAFRGSLLLTRAQASP